GTILGELLSKQHPAPYVRRVWEPWSMVRRVPGARLKRLFLSALGGRGGRAPARAWVPRNDRPAGVTHPPWGADPESLTRWLARVPGRVVELTCPPGYEDRTLIGRDCTPDDGQLQRRVCEMRLLRDPSFPEACRRAGLALVTPADVVRHTARGFARA